MSDFYHKILNSIPQYVGETFLEREVREVIALEIQNALSDQCSHEFKTVSEVKIIDAHVCKKCGKLKK